MGFGICPSELYLIWSLKKVQKLLVNWPKIIEIFSLKLSQKSNSPMITIIILLYYFIVQIKFILTSLLLTNINSNKEKYIAAEDRGPYCMIYHAIMSNISFVCGFTLQATQVSRFYTKLYWICMIWSVALSPFPIRDFSWIFLLEMIILKKWARKNLIKWYWCVSGEMNDNYITCIKPKSWVLN